jgi:hypothetical protein
MNAQPNLFLADLGPELDLTPATVRDACLTIRRNRDAWLSKLRTRQIAEIIAYTAEQWLEPDCGFRARLLQEAPPTLGIGTSTLARGLDTFLRQLTLENLEGVVIQDLGDAKRLDDFSSGVIEVRHGRSAMARGPLLLGHLTAGNLPVPALHSMVLGLLVRSAQFIKCASGASLVPRLFAHSLAQTEPRIASSLEIAEWSRDSSDLDAALFSEVDCLTATGSDEMLTDVRSRVPIRTRFLGYGHRVSFAYVSGEMLSTYSTRRVIRDLANDVTAWNQLGCLSPHVIYVQDDGALSPEGVAEQLAEELARREAEDPRGDIPLPDANAIVSRRAVYQLRAAMSQESVARISVESAFRDTPTGVRIWTSPDSTAWTVVHDADPRFELSCLNRFIYVKGVRQFSEVLRFAEPVRRHISTVAIAAPDSRAIELARELARWGVPRVCPVGRMQDPPFAWRHDGRPALGDLIEWTDFETA